MSGLGARSALAELDGIKIDVLIIGGGINGCSTAQHLAAEGYDVLLVEKNDFASAASSRSSRIVHCGLRYLAPERSPLDFLTQPRRLRTAVSMAVRSLQCRRQFLATTPERLRNLDMAIPIYQGDAYPGWQVDIGAAMLGALNLGGPSIHYQRRKPEVAAATHPLVACLRAPETLASVFSFRDHQVVWPERVCMDALLAAKRLGATVRNYTEVTGLEALPGGGWRAVLEERLEDRVGGAEPATVEGRVLLNFTGVWIDGVNRMAAPTKPPSRKIVAVKGTHIAVRLPEKFRGFGLAGHNREHEHIFCLPWGDLHYIGPTETVYDGDIEDVQPTEDDISFLLDEANYLLPKLDLKRADVELAWAGARPITYDPDRAKGRRAPAGVFHDLAREGMGDAITVTWGWVMHHRETARKAVRRVRKISPPRRARAEVSYAAIPFPENTNTLPLVADIPEVTIGVLRHVAEREAPAHLVDILYRRTDVGWRATLPPEAVRQAAESVAGVLGWDAARVAQEVEDFQAYARKQHLQG
ncbi:MAG: FAD-dependent oxidoreductase [Hyphomicrobiaceae bacterium]